MEIYNLALIQLGSPTVTATNENTKEVNTFNAVYPYVVRDVLSAFQFKFSLETTQIYQSPEQSVTAINVNGNTATVTLNNHGYQEGDIIKIDGASNKLFNGKFRIFNVFQNLFDYTISKSETVNPTGSITARLSNIDFEYAYRLPTDLLLPVRLLGDTRGYRVNNTTLFCDIEDKIYLEYVKNNTSTGNSPVGFDFLIAYKLASATAVSITSDIKLAEVLELKYYHKLLEVMREEAYKDFDVNYTSYNNLDETKYWYA